MKSSTGTYWTIHHGDELVGTIVPGPARYDYPFPWQSGTFTPASGYDEVKTLLAVELRLMEDEGEWDRNRFWDEIRRRNISLKRHPDGETITVFELHINGSEVLWKT